MDSRPAAKTRPSRISAGARTNVPQWPPLAPALPTGARRWVIVDLGAATVAERWHGQAETGGTVVDVVSLAAGGQSAGGQSAGGQSAAVQPADGQTAVAHTEARLDEIAVKIAADAVVGTRVAVCGAEADALYLRARLLAAGFLDEELLIHASSNDEIRVRCSHCSGVARHIARPGDAVWCVTCGYSEIVHHHFSRNMAAFMAFRVVAEDPPNDQP